MGDCLSSSHYEALQEIEYHKPWPEDAAYRLGRVGQQYLVGPSGQGQPARPEDIP